MMKQMHTQTYEIYEKIQNYENIWKIPIYKTLAHRTIRTTRNQTNAKKLKNRKSHGSDGIIGETLKCLSPWITHEITILTNKIQQGGEIHPIWLEGTLAHIYKNKGGPKECAPYRPICLTQMIYKIWPKLLTTRLTQILHIITAQTQYGYKMNTSTIDAIIKLEDYLENKTPNSNILLMDLTKAFDTINRTMLWTTLYRKGLPISTINRIRRRRKNTQLQAKENGQYGKK